MNIVNKITSSRILFAAIFYFLFNQGNIWASYFAFLFFVLATITDFYDGYLARKYNVITKFGQLIDPLADKLLVLCALLSFIQKDIIPAWMVIIILSREFLVMGIRVLASSSGEVIPAKESGKYKTVVQLEVIIVILSLFIFRETCGHFFVPIERIFMRDIFFDKLVIKIFDSGPYYFMLIAVMVTVLSGIDYWKRTKKVFDGEV